MSTMRERLIWTVAESLWTRHAKKAPDRRWSDLNGGSREHWYREAEPIVDAVLAELETPDEGMVEAGTRAATDDWLDPTSEPQIGYSSTQVAFTAMIRAVREP